MSTAARIPWTVITPEMVTQARLVQGRQRLTLMGAQRVELLPDTAVLWYADRYEDVQAQLAAALGEELAA